MRKALPILGLALLGPASAQAADVPVTSTAELIQAVNQASAGDRIILAPGTYRVSQNLRATASGTQAQPIEVRAEVRGTATIEFDALEGFKVSGPWWIFENLVFKGVCANHSRCEHALHIVRNADHTVVRNNILQDFNAQIKGNGEGDPIVFPDDVLVEQNEFFNSSPRNTSNPVTPIDVVGGRRWILRKNYIHDHQKAQGNRISYAAFLKGNSKDGIIEGNLVICEQLHSGGIRLGLSFGGGGTGPDRICEEGTCTPEHEGGIMRNNIIVNCPQDVGIYVNECKDCFIDHNTLHLTTGIDIRFEASVCDVRNNLLSSGQIRRRNNSTLRSTFNMQSVGVTAFNNWFMDPAAGDFRIRSATGFADMAPKLSNVTDDFCQQPRSDAMADPGAMEAGNPGCDTTQPHLNVSMTPDAGMSTPDAGSVDSSVNPDAGSEDSSVAPDAAPAADAGSQADSGMSNPDATVAVDSGMVAADAGVGVDSGTAEPKEEGCGCTGVEQREFSSLNYLVLALIGLWGWRRRR